MVDERRAVRGKMQCCGATMQLVTRVFRARETKGVRTQGRVIRKGHPMQKGGEGAPRSMQSFSAGPPSTTARASGAGVQTNPQRQKRPDSHSNEVPTPSPERLYVSRSLWGMCPPP